MKLSIAVATLLVAVVAGGSVEERLVLKYGKMKMLESCIGKEELKAQKTLLKDAYKTCKSKPPNFKSQDSASEDQNSQADKPAEGEYRYFTEEKVRSLSQKLAFKISNKTCVYRELGFMDESGEIVYDNIIKKINDVEGLDQELRDDLVDGVTSCQKVAACTPTDNLPVPFTASMIRFKVFYKCNKQKKLIACLKKDLRAKREEFDFTGSDELYSDMEEDDKMLAVIWGMTALNDMGYE